MWEPWMEYAGYELANPVRTMAYLQSGLVADPRITVFQGGFCECASLDEGPYVNPLTDDAPWYEPTRPESEDFLGLFIHYLDVSAPFARTATPRGNGGYSLGSLTELGRIVQVRGYMLSADKRAQTYGQRWLTEVLRGDCTDECGISDLCLLMACPATEADEGDWFRTLKRAGIISGPTFIDIPDVDCGLIQEVSFQMAAEEPHLFTSTPVLDADDLTLPVSQAVTTDPWIGDATFIITLTAGGPLAVENAVITIQPTKATALPCSEILVDYLPSGRVLVIDGTTRRVEVREQSSGRVTGGLDALDLTGGLFDWPDLGPCSSATVTVTAQTSNANTRVHIEQYLRES